MYESDHTVASILEDNMGRPSIPNKMYALHVG